MTRARREDGLEEARLRVLELEAQVVKLRGELLRVVQFADDGKDLAELIPRLRRVSGEMYVDRWTDKQIVAAYHRWTEEVGEPPSARDWNPTGGLRLSAEQIAFFYAGKYPTFGAVRNHFGTWNNLVIVAGGDPRDQGDNGGRGGGTAQFDGMPEWHGWDYLAVYRARAGLTQRMVADAAGISIGSYSGMEKGGQRYVNPQIRTVLAVARALEVPAALLVEDSGELPPAHDEDDQGDDPENL